MGTGEYVTFDDHKRLYRSDVRCLVDKFGGYDTIRLIEELIEEYEQAKLNGTVDDEA